MASMTEAQRQSLRQRADAVLWDLTEIRARVDELVARRPGVEREVDELTNEARAIMQAAG